jgi:hypothetical protein
MPGVKGRSLERECHEDNLAAAASAGFFLGCGEQSGSEPLSASRFVHPELTDFQTAAPGVSGDPCDDSLPIVSHQDRQPLAVRDACGGRVVLV